MNSTHIIYFLLLICRNTDSAQSDEPVYKITDKVFTCSKWLSSMIDNFCNNVYKIVKRDTSLLIDKLMPKDLENSRSANALHNAERKYRRVRRQVATECCEQPCTVAIIIKYCPVDAKLLRENPSLFD